MVAPAVADLLVGLSCFLLSASLASNAQTPLHTSSFEVLTSVHHNEKDGNLDVQLKESYSHDQGRGLVSIRFSGLSEWLAKRANGTRDEAALRFEAATFFADPQREIALARDDGSGKCRKVDSSQLLELLELELAQELDKKYEHVIGPARWILWLAGQRQRMTPDAGKTRWLVRNVVSSKYSMTLETGAGGQLEVSVFYEKLSSGNDAQLPRRIVFKRDSTRITFYEIHSIKLLDASAQRSASLARLELDAFILLPTSGCSLLLGKDHRKTLFELWGHKSGAPEARHFSFRAQVEHAGVRGAPTGAPFSAWVAYDARLDMMRVDLEKATGAQEAGGEEGGQTELELKSTRQLFNFFRNRMYHLMPSQSGSFLVNHMLRVDKPLASVAAVGGNSSNETGRKFASSTVCAATQIRTTTSLRKYSLGQLLWGSNSFVYLGRARVRNLQTRVFESVGAELPYWLEQPVDYRANGNANSGDDSTRLASNKNSPLEGEPLVSGGHLITLVYVVGELEAGAEPAMLLMEIYHMDEDYKQLYDKRTIEFNHFSWSLSSALSGPMKLNGLGELFSLAGDCAAGAASGEQAAANGRLELLLERVAPFVGPQEEALRVFETSANARRSSVLPALQRSLNLLVNSVSDLQTQIVQQASAGPNDDKRLNLLVSFNLVELSNQTSELVYVGRGLRVAGKSWFFQLASFFQCFMLAAHRQVPLHFGYEPKQKHCFISVKTVERVAQDGDLPFELDSSKGNLEIYETFLVRDQQHTILELFNQRDGDDDDDDNGARKLLRLRDRHLSLYLNEAPSDEDEIPLRMDIRRLKITGTLKSSERKSARNKANFQAEIQGFGLMARAEAGILPRVEALSFGQCEAICLGDFDCESFSFCIRGIEVECLTSSTSFSSPFFAAKLERAGAQSNDTTKPIDIELDEEPFHFRKHSMCAIYNKQYLRHFRRKSASATSWHKLVVTPAASVEDCARDCFGRNLDIARTIERELGQSMESLKAIGDAAATPAASNHRATLELVANSSRRLLLNGCYNFYYLDLLELAAQPEVARDELNKFAGPASGGYCALHVLERALDKDAASALRAYQFYSPVSLDLYEFQFGDLFEEQAGVHLLAAPSLDQRERSLLTKLRATFASGAALKNVQHSDTRLVLELLERGENLQSEMVGNREICAAMCFKQTSGVWPSCQSFDVLLERVLGRLRMKCLFNSITKRRAIELDRWDLIDARAQTLERWHYEPKLLGAQAQYLAELQRAGLSLEQSRATVCATKPLSLIIELLLLALGLATGLKLSVVLTASRLLKGRLLATRKNSQVVSLATDGLGEAQHLELEENI